MNANGVDDLAKFQPPRGERPRLLPYNRKLRHLVGVTLRNLSVRPTSKRQRRKTIDDEALPFALKSPTKLLASSDENKLSQSRSFTDLKAHAGIPEDEEHQPNGYAVGPATSSPKSPDRIRMRRRSTLDWMDATAKQKLRSLEDKVALHVADIFFTIHVDEVEEDPIYISEVLKQSMNPNFRAFDLNACSAAITRRHDATFKFWIRQSTSDRWNLLMDLSVNMRYMHFLGNSLEDFNHPLPENCVLLHLSDGLYACFNDMLVASEDSPIILPSKETVTSLGEPTSSYDALRKLSTLDECIQDAIATREKLATEINNLIVADKQRFCAADDLEGAKDRLSFTKRSLASERRLTKVASSRVEELQTSIRARRAAMATSTVDQAQTSDEMAGERPELQQLQDSHHTMVESMTAQRRRICSELLHVYPIEPIPNKTLAFTIRGLALPNSNFKAAAQKDDEIDAALGYVAHLVHLLSFYLSTPLPYPVHPCSSVSSVTDPISLMPAPTSASASSAQYQNNRTFPLHLGRGSSGSSVPFFRFEYGVFLLNKDIELLAAKQGLRVLDIRQTLPNLLYLLYVVTAGSGELPGRKAGGVRGLMRDWNKERRASEDSLAWSSSTAVEDENAPADTADKGKGKAGA